MTSATAKKLLSDPSHACKKLRASSARRKLLEALHSKGSMVAGELLLTDLEESRDHLDLAAAANVAIVLGLPEKARKLLSNAAKRAIAEGVSGNALGYVQQLRVFDPLASAKLFRAYVRQEAKREDEWRYFRLAGAFEQWGDKKRATRYRQLALGELLRRDYLTGDEVLTVIELMKSLGRRERAKAFAAEYVREVLGDSKATFSFELGDISLDANLPMRDRTLIKILVEVGMGKSLMSDTLMCLKMRLRKSEPLGKGMHVLEYLAELTSDKSVPREIYRAAAKRCESERKFDMARKYYGKAHSLDQRTSDRLAIKKARLLLSDLESRHPSDYESFWNTTEYLVRQEKPDSWRPKTPRIPLDVVYKLGLGGETLELFDTVAQIRKKRMRRIVLAEALKRLTELNLLREAAMVAEQLDPKQAKRMWLRASYECEPEAASDEENRSRLFDAMIFAKRAGDKGRPHKLLVRLIQSLCGQAGSNRDTHFYELAAKNVSRDFYETEKTLCEQVIEHLKGAKKYLTLARLYLELGIIDKAIMEQALTELEQKREYSEAAKVAKAIGDEEAASVYLFLENEAQRSQSVMRLSPP